MYKQGLSYSGLSTARAAINAYTTTCGGKDLSSNILLKKFFRGVFHNRPSVPKHLEVWDVKIIFNYWCSSDNDSLMFLSGKLCTLFLLLSAQRCQTLHLVQLADIKLEKEQIVVYPNHLLKQSRPKYHIAPIILKRYGKNTKLCIVETFKQYLHRSKGLRHPEETKLLISTQKPHKGVSKDTIARWVKQTMTNAGIDRSFTTHSTRAVATSTAKSKGVCLSVIAKTAGWSNVKTFHKFYEKPVTNMSFQEALLE